MNKMQDGKTVLDTGTTSGIGLSLATKFYDNGFKVFGTGRFPEQHANKLPFELLD
jgi:short-subunit dehydrogenase involved in D-alanine esterification of teichoic acids